MYILHGILVQAFLPFDFFSCHHYPPPACKVNIEQRVLDDRELFMNKQ